MPLPLSSTVIAQKNALASKDAFLLALKLDIPGITDPVRIVRNVANLEWGGYTWIAIDFRMEPINEDDKGEVPQVVVRIDNTSRSMEAIVQAYDAYKKTHARSTIVATAYAIATADLASGVAASEHEFELQGVKTDRKWATFGLGVSNPYNRRHPKARILKDHCKFDEPVGTLNGFKGPLCKYAGSETACNRTLVRCRVLQNSNNFGGNAGVVRGGSRGA